MATESFGRLVRLVRLVRLDDKKTFPGASAQYKLLVNGTQMTVAIRLQFKESPCTTITDRLNPGSEPVGSERSAHHTSPRLITTMVL